MNQQNSHNLQPDKETCEFQPTSFKTMPFLAVILLIILFISQAIQWYSQSVTLPRFCEDPELAIHNLREIVTKRSPAGNRSRRPYIIAAKLVYLLPQHSNEPVDDYIHRVRREISLRCMR